MEKDHTFIISIDDGDCKYNFPFTIKNGNDISIRKIYEGLCKLYHVKPIEGTLWPSEQITETNITQEDSYGK